MTLEIIGTFSHRNRSERQMPRPGPIEPDFMISLVEAFDANGFDRVLVAQSSSWPDPLVSAAFLAAHCRRLGFMIAHRPGFIAPTMAARMFATLDRMTGGRVAPHIISAPNDVETQADGDFLTRDARHLRSAEYIGIMRREWQGERFDHEGPFYRMAGARSDVVPLAGTMPIFFGGRSEQALRTAAAHADVYAFGVETLAQSADLIGDLRARAQACGRDLRYCMSARIILGDTEEQAWANAYAVLDDVTAAVAAMGGKIGTLGRSERSAALAAQGDILDERLWMGISKATLFQKAANSFVGTAESVSDALLRYYDLGVTSFLISGFDHLPCIAEFGRTLIPMLRAKAAGRMSSSRQPSARAGHVADFTNEER